MLDKLRAITERYTALDSELSDPNIVSNIDRYRSVLKARSELEPIVDEYRRYASLVHEAEALNDMLLTSDDPEFSSLIRREIAENESLLAGSEEKLRLALIPKDPNDEKNVILEIRAGTGGEEAALFVSDLMRMYTRYAERSGFRKEVLSSSPTDMGGFKEVILSLSGPPGSAVFSKLKFESGVHRVQRIPVTDTQGKIQTSAATIAVMPEVTDLAFELKDADLRIDTFRSGGAGGQHVNKTESAIRITHLPTGIVVQCQDEKSQFKNKEQAMRVLKSRVNEFYESEQMREVSLQRKAMVGSGDRSERIRTYNYPQNRVTDHRISLTLHKLDSFLDGDMDEIVNALILHERSEKMKNGV